MRRNKYILKLLKMHDIFVFLIFQKWSQKKKKQKPKNDETIFCWIKESFENLNKNISVYRKFCHPVVNSINERERERERRGVNNVLKTGPDRPVRPVEPPTGQLFGSIRLKEPFCGRTGIEPFKPPVGPPNRTNRPVFHEPAKPSF